MAPMMRTGDIDVLAFIGGSKAADAIIKEHPHPHRLKIFLQLEGKNPGIVLQDADLNVAADQVTLGTTSYNGQRCTAIKIVFVHSSVAPIVLGQVVTKSKCLACRTPVAGVGAYYSAPEPAKPKMIREWIADAVSKGAYVYNGVESGGLGGTQEGALCHPAIIYPVNSSMRLWHEEQFGPVIPVAVFDELSEIVNYVATSPYGQCRRPFSPQTRKQVAKHHNLQMCSAPSWDASTLTHNVHVHLMYFHFLDVVAAL